MSALIPFDFSAPVPAIAREKRVSKINQEAMLGGSTFPVLSIKGKVFTLIKDQERKVLMRTITGQDGEPEQMAVTSLSLAVIRQNANVRVFYGKGYVEGDSDGTKPDCFSNDGQHPDAGAAYPQAKNCQACPHSVWNSKITSEGVAKGTACSVQTRLAVVDPNFPKTPFLLRVPAASRRNFSDAVKLVDAHGKDYNEVIYRVSFDNEAPSPKLKFEPRGILTPEVQALVTEQYEAPLTLDIIGRAVPGGADATPDAPAAGATTPEFAAAVAAAAVQKAASPAKPAAEPESALGSALGAAAETKPAETKSVKATKPVKAVKPAAAASDDDAAGLLGELGALLGNKDD